MIIQVDETGTVKGFLSLLENMTADENIHGLIILACDDNGFTPATVDKVLKSVSIPVFGGIFPAIIHGSQKMDKGTIVAGLSKKPTVYSLPHLSDNNLDHDEAIANLIPGTGNATTMFVLVDGYSQGICALIDSLYSNVGTGVSYLGGGAGSINPDALDMQNRPCLFSNDGLIKDAALLALVEIDTGIGVDHGWHKISGPYKVTESSGNEIISLDLRPAFEVYKEIIKQHSGETITPENFFDVAKGYPFGISRLESNFIVRDPFTVAGDHIVVATPIPQESFIDVLTGNPDSLVGAAQKSFSAGLDAYNGRKDKTIFVVDCISRALFLGDCFDQEIEAVTQENTPLIGILSLGEIANSGRDYMELYNKTCVVGILGD